MPLVPLRPSGGRRNPTGLLLALAFALIGAGVVLFVFISGKPRTPGSAIPGDVARMGELPSVVGEASDIVAVGGTRDARFQVPDKNDPSRVAVELVFAKLDPLGSGVYQAAEPRAWVYMKDGRTVFIRSDTGRIRRSPTATAPESGEFSGNGLVLVFPPRAPGDDRPIDPLNDTPGMVMRFVAATFDTVLLEVSSQDEWTAESEQMWATGKGFVVRGNQVLERLEFAKINSNGQIRYHSRPKAVEVASDATFAGPPEPPELRPKGKHARQHPAETPTGPDSGGEFAFVGPPEPPKPAPTPKEDLYLAEFRDNVTLVQTERKLTADMLSVWTRFLDNKLPDDAIGGTADGPVASLPASGRARDPGAPAVVSVPMPLPARLAALALTQTHPIRTLFTKSDTDIVLNWSGVMVARPIKDGRTPPELASGNHVHARFTAERPGGAARVVLTDLDTGAVGICSALDYAATTQDLTLSRGPSSERVDLTVPGAGRFVVPRVTVNLASGVGHIDGAGALLNLPDNDAGNLVTVNPEHPRPADPDAPLPEGLIRQITWTESADFAFGTRERRITDALKSADFHGSVVARDRASWLSGDRIAAEFAERPEKKSGLKHLTVRGHALGVARSDRYDPETAGPAQDPFITADELDVAFAPSKIAPREDDATSLLASGSVRIGDRRGRITADRFESQLIRKSRSDYEAGDVKARGGVRIDLAGAGGNVWAQADEFHADGQSRWADFIGDRVVLAQGSSRIYGRQMHLEEADGRLEVFGPGSMRRLRIASDASDSALQVPEEVLDAPESGRLPEGVTVMRATWSRSMSFTDRTGRIECHGDATVTATSHDGGQVARSQRLFIDITPRAAGNHATGAPLAAGEHGAAAPAPGTLAGAFGADDPRTDDRKLLRIESIGSILERDGGQPASVKSWKFAPLPGPDGQREYEQVLYLEGPKIIVDETAGTTTIPDAGRGVTLDRAGGTSGAAPTDGPAAIGSHAPGRSQFTWGGSMEFNRLTGRLRMQRDVELRHLPLDSNELIRMVCADLTAEFDMHSGHSAQLRNAEARGAVYAESGPRRLTADVFSYDAATGVADARSLTDVPVSMQDDRQPAPMLARSLRWNTRTDRVEITEPMPVTGGLSR